MTRKLKNLCPSQVPSQPCDTDRAFVSQLPRICENFPKGKTGRPSFKTKAPRWRCQIGACKIHGAGLLEQTTGAIAFTVNGGEIPTIKPLCRDTVKGCKSLGHRSDVRTQRVGCFRRCSLTSKTATKPMVEIEGANPSACFLRDRTTVVQEPHKLPVGGATPSPATNFLSFSEGGPIVSGVSSLKKNSVLFHSVFGSAPTSDLVLGAVCPPASSVHGSDNLENPIGRLRLLGRCR